MSLAEKLKKIRSQLDKVNADAGRVVAGFIDDEEIANSLTVKFIPTPNDDLNEAVGGGFPVGRTTIISGLPDSGKTSLALETIGLQMKKDPNFTCLWLESENSLEMEYITKVFGIVPSRFVVIETTLKDGGERALDQAASLLRTGSFNMFVINSLKALVPKTQLNKAISEDTVALQARMNAKAMSQYVSIAHEFGVTVVIIQHLSTLIGSLSRDPYALAGGLFLKHSAALTLDMRKQSVLDSDPITKEEGAKFKISVKKNHVKNTIFPYVSVMHYIIWGCGVEVILTTLKKALEQGILRSSGAWIYWDERQLKWNGKQSFREAMKQDPDLLQTLRNLVNGDITALTDAEKAELGIDENEADEMLAEDPDMAGK